LELFVLIDILLFLIMPFFFEFLLKLLHNHTMILLIFRFAIVIYFLKLIDCSLELFKSLFLISLGLLLLLLKEFKFTFPKSFLFFKLTLKISMLSFDFIELWFPVFNLFSNTLFSLVKSIVKLIILISEFGILNFIWWYQIFLLSFKILIFLHLNSFFSISLTLR